jgi:hypothetical protein
MAGGGWGRLLAGVAALAVGLVTSAVAERFQASECARPRPAWLACEDFESGGDGWSAWFAGSPWVECNGCPNGRNDPDRIRLTNELGVAHSGAWALHLPGAAEAGYQGASLTYRTCAAEKRPGCRLDGYEQMYLRAWVRLAPDHDYVHHFLEVAGTRPHAYWESDGNAGCRPDGQRWAGTTLDFQPGTRALHFYTYFPGMRCDSGRYCSGDYVAELCTQCAGKNMPCTNGPECCWGNHFAPDPPVVLPRDRWVCLELGMGLNTPGEADGWMEFWVDGQSAHRVDGMHWRDDPTLQLNKAWLQHYIASGDTTRSQQIWFDDVVVSTEHIGCAPRFPSPTASATANETETPRATPGVPTAPPVPPTPTSGPVSSPVPDLYLPALRHP